MGTRSLTIIKDRYDEDIVVMYRQMDGYPSGMGRDLYEFLKGMYIVNGIGSKDPPKIANGMNCLSAQIVAHFKDEVGGIYLYPAGTRMAGEEYLYTIYPIENRVGMNVESVWCSWDQDHYKRRTLLYSGIVDKFDPDKEY